MTGRPGATIWGRGYWQEGPDLTVFLCEDFYDHRDSVEDILGQCLNARQDPRTIQVCFHLCVCSGAVGEKGESKSQNQSQQDAEPLSRGHQAGAVGEDVL